MEMVQMKQGEAVTGRIVSSVPFPQAPAFLLGTLEEEGELHVGDREDSRPSCSPSAFID